MSTAPPLHLIRLMVDRRAMNAFAARRKLLDDDLGYALHLSLRRRFGEAGPQPFRLMSRDFTSAAPERAIVLGYSRDAAGLERRFRDGAVSGNGNDDERLRRRSATRRRQRAVARPWSARGRLPRRSRAGAGHRARRRAARHRHPEADTGRPLRRIARHTPATLLIRSFSATVAFQERERARAASRNPRARQVSRARAGDLRGDPREHTGSTVTRVLVPQLYRSSVVRRPDPFGRASTGRKPPSGRLA